MDGGETRDFETVYRLYAPLMGRYLRALGCPGQDMEDVIHDAFVKALLHMEDYRGECGLSVWLCRIARNTWFSLLRRQKRSFPLPETEEGVWDQVWCEWTELIDALPEPYRGVFRARVLEDQGYRDIGGAFGKSESWARVTFAVVADLIPLYLDGSCSGESRALVEEHTARCPACQKLLADMGDGPAEPTAEHVLRQTARQFGRQAALRAAGAAAIVLYWLVYLWQEALADVGNYRWFPYSFHEAYTLGYLLVPLLTLIWLAALLIRCVRRRTWRKNGAMLAVLAVLLTAQGGYLWNQAGVVHVTSWSRVVAVPDEYHIIIEGSEGQVTLATTPLVANLVQTDGTIYGFSYDSRRNDPDEGRLTFVYGIAE